MAAEVIAISNQKGGVAKTTTTFSLGASLAEMGYRTLVVDLDSQANLTLAAGHARDQRQTGDSDTQLTPDTHPASVCPPGRLLHTPP